MLSTRSLELLDYISFAILSLLQPYTDVCDIHTDRHTDIQTNIQTLWLLEAHDLLDRETKKQFFAFIKRGRFDMHD